jgi:multisubunit Na+/H+ antiporter MnhE subunit
MKLLVLNITMLVAWLMVTAGGILLNVGAGLIVGGLFLSVQTLVVARMFGLYRNVSNADRR